MRHLLVVLAALLPFAEQVMAEDFVDDLSAMEAVWYRKAAEQGDARSQALLGGMYHQGQRVPKDDVQAYAWFSLAAAQGNATAKRGKDIVARTMTDEQLAKAQALSQDFREKYVEPFEKD